MVQHIKKAGTTTPRLQIQIENTLKEKYFNNHKLSSQNLPQDIILLTHKEYFLYVVDIPNNISNSYLQNFLESCLEERLPIARDKVTIDYYFLYMPNTDSTQKKVKKRQVYIVTVLKSILRKYRERYKAPKFIIPEIFLKHMFVNKKINLHGWYALLIDKNVYVYKYETNRLLEKDRRHFIDKTDVARRANNSSSQRVDNATKQQTFVEAMQEIINTYAISEPVQALHLGNASSTFLYSSELDILKWKPITTDKTISKCYLFKNTHSIWNRIVTGIGLVLLSVLIGLGVFYFYTLSEWKNFLVAQSRLDDSYKTLNVLYDTLQEKTLVIDKGRSNVYEVLSAVVSGTSQDFKILHLTISQDDIAIKARADNALLNMEMLTNSKFFSSVTIENVTIVDNKEEFMLRGIIK